MCVALPGKVISIENNIAKVDFDGNIVNAHAGLLKIAVGDYVLVHAGMIIQKMNENEAQEISDIFKTLEELGE